MLITMITVVKEKILCMVLRVFYLTKKNRYAGRLFKVAQSLPGASEAPPLPPTTVVADFKRRRKETEAERFVILIR